MNPNQNSQESNRKSSSSSSSRPRSEDVEPVPVTTAFNRGTQTPADFNNVRASNQNNQNVENTQGRGQKWAQEEKSQKK